jgi:hypothetical protein
MRARFMGFFPRLNPLALVPLGLGPKNLAKHNFKSKVSQLAGLNFLEPRFSSKHANHRSKQTRNPGKHRSEDGSNMSWVMMVPDIPMSCSW